MVFIPCQFGIKIQYFHSVFFHNYWFLIFIFFRTSTCASHMLNRRIYDPVCFIFPISFFTFHFSLFTDSCAKIRGLSDLAMLNRAFSPWMLSVSLFTFHFSLFTFHFSPFTDSCATIRGLSDLAILNRAFSPWMFRVSPFTFHFSLFTDSCAKRSEAFQTSLY